MTNLWFLYPNQIFKIHSTRNLIYYVKEAIKDDPELYDWILNYDELQDLKIRGTRDGIKGKSPAVDIMLSSDKQFVILTMDCAFYLLEKE